MIWDGKNPVRVVIHEDVELLDEVIVTAVGIKQMKRKIGYSTQQIKSDVLEQQNSLNVGSSLRGQVAGLRVTNPTGLFQSPEITVRGQRPLIVVDDFTSYDGGNPILPYSTINDKAVAGNVSKPHTRYYQSSTNEPRVLLGASEVHMIIAEGITRGWVSGNAGEHYAKGIQESFMFYATHVPQYSPHLTPEAASKYIQHKNVTLNGMRKEEQIKRIVTQTYIVHYFSGQWTGYQNYLRTGYPEFLLPAEVKAPTRWMYPSSEYNNNAENVNVAIQRQFGASETIHSPMWWLGR